MLRTSSVCTTSDEPNARSGSSFCRSACWSPMGSSVWRRLRRWVVGGVASMGFAHRAGGWRPAGSGDGQRRGSRIVVPEPMACEFELPTDRGSGRYLRHDEGFGSAPGSSVRDRVAVGLALGRPVSACSADGAFRCARCSALAFAGGVREQSGRSEPTAARVRRPRPPPGSLPCGEVIASRCRFR